LALTGRAPVWGLTTSLKVNELDISQEAWSNSKNLCTMLFRLAKLQRMKIKGV